MQSYEDAPPPYPGISSNDIPVVVTSKGDYRGVPVYQVGPSNVPVYSQTTYQQQAPLLAVHPGMLQPGVVQFGCNPVHCICPQCHSQIITGVDRISGAFAWLMCFLLLILGCVPCCLIPFCASSCQDTVHTCPHCSATLGRYKVL